MLKKLIKVARLARWVPKYFIGSQKIGPEFFAGKRVAVVGPASSAYVEKNGKYIDGFDVVIRINRAVRQFERNSEEQDYVGTKTTLLFHQLMRKSFRTGEIAKALLERYGVAHVVFSRTATRSGVRKVLAYYDHHPEGFPISLLKPKLYEEICRPFDQPRLRPTNGYIALAAVLKSDFSELYVTGFTFYRTPYTRGYRDAAASYEQMLEEGWHNPDIEFDHFKSMVEALPEKNISMDKGLQAIW